MIECRYLWNRANRATILFNNKAQLFIVCFYLTQFSFYYNIVSDEKTDYFWHFKILFKFSETTCEATSLHYTDTPKQILIWLRLEKDIKNSLAHGLKQIFSHLSFYFYYFIQFLISLLYYCGMFFLSNESVSPWMLSVSQLQN